jgi:hypothetical protein
MRIRLESGTHGALSICVLLAEEIAVVQHGAVSGRHGPANSPLDFAAAKSQLVCKALDFLRESRHSELFVFA